MISLALMSALLVQTQVGYGVDVQVSNPHVMYYGSPQFQAAFSAEATISFPSFSALAFQGCLTLPYGIEGNVKMMLINSDFLRLYTITGIGIPAYFASVPDLNRKYDLTIGAGFDLKASNHFWLSLNWKAYFPDPSKYITYSGFIVPILKEALSESRVSFHITYEF